MKTPVSITPKIRFFLKGLVYGFGEKFEILLTFRFIENTPKKVLGDVVARKQAFLHNKKLQKVEVFSSFLFIKNRSRKSVC